MNGAVQSRALRPLLVRERAEGRRLWLFGLLLLVPLAVMASTVTRGDDGWGPLLARFGWLYLYVIAFALRQVHGDSDRRARFTEFETGLPVSMRALAWARFRANALARIPPFVAFGLAGLLFAERGRLELAFGAGAIIVWLAAGDAARRFVEGDRLRMHAWTRRAIVAVEGGAVFAVLVAPELAAWTFGLGASALAAALIAGRVPDVVLDDPIATSERPRAGRAPRFLARTSSTRLLVREVSLSPQILVIALWSIAFVPALIHLGQGLIFYVWMFPIFAAGLATARARFMARFGHVPVRTGHVFTAMFVPVLAAIVIAFVASLAVGVRVDRSTRSGISVSHARHQEHGDVAPQQLSVPVEWWRVGRDPRPEVELADGTRAEVAAFPLRGLPLYAYHPFMVPAGAGVDVWAGQLARALEDVYGIERNPAELAELFRTSSTGVAPAGSFLEFESNLGVDGSTPVRNPGLWRGGVEWLAYLLFFGLSATWWMRDRTPSPTPRPWRPVLLWAGTLAAATAVYLFFGLRLSEGLPLGSRETLVLVASAVVPMSVPGIVLVSAFLIAVFGLASWRIARHSCADLPPNAPRAA